MRLRHGLRRLRPEVIGVATWPESPRLHAAVDPDDGEAIAECHEDNNGAADEVTCPPLLP